ncbi:hypothetical protein A8C75_10655 [Marinobacterium aestuarii]|uniref:Uncharacterized protein n=1 Tax=Marinobacterium aestuarii TaxID=1821621 RepID=A0A1A9EZE3_9GAMM|nr:DUF6482 family protein [Marinobacterium aestuarii]ANG62899.1 hypothetical protein A8C75_10655 [Marinobacterium aestuarii]
MQISEFKALVSSHKLKAVNFIESGCGPMVVEVEYEGGKDLIKNSDGAVFTCLNVTQAYDLCHRAGVHEANLVQVTPHDETCAGVVMDYHRDSIPLKF